jgi:hypothetical protein
MLDSTAALFKVEKQPCMSVRGLIRTADLLESLSESNDLSSLPLARVGKTTHGPTHTLEKRAGVSAVPGAEHNQTRPATQDGAATVGGSRRAVVRKRKQG